MRVLSMWWVIQGHTFGFSVSFLDNLVIISELMKRFTFQALSNATFSVDSFFFLSGLLVAYLTLNALRENNGKLNWLKFILHRFWRLTPALAFCIMVYSTLFLHVVHGPMVKTMLKGDMFEACKTTWWPNLIYINNFYPSYGDVGKQCMGWTWYLANDMQFYLISPILLYPLYRWRRVGIAMVMFLILTCLIVGSVIARVYQMCAAGCPITHHTEDLYAHHDTMYNKPFTRIAPYLVGMLTGYILSVTKCRLRINKFLVALGWLIAAAINISVLYGLYGLQHGQVFSPDINALYMGTSRFAWSLGLAWVALACATGKGGPVNDILSWRVWAPLGRLTYCAYLFHPLVLFCYYGNKRKTVHYTDIELSTVFVGNLTLSYAVAFLVSMIVEALMLSLEKLVFKKK
ncbi:nose resistant to fluoxetine protein 6-like [Liolophura sinensis]|uniref:nose resistant to fluoxetine protein 6-like n=1 Tax=Liolophura sinensis TaxID=3198878 RepID=UPI0031592C1A